MLRVYTWCRGWTANCYAAQLQLFRPNAEVGYDLAPGFRLRSGVFRTSINSLGLHGEEISRAKPSGMRRIAVVGESSAFGYLVSDGQEAARLLEVELRRRGLDVQVINGAVPGYNLYQSTVRFREVLAPLEPDVVLLYAGWNDLPYITSPDPRAERFRLRSVAPAWERMLGHSVLYGFVVYRIWGGPVRLVPAEFAAAEPTPGGIAAFRGNLRHLADDVGAAGARLVVCAQASAAHPDVAPALRPALARDAQAQDASIRLGQWLHGELRDFAAEHGLPFLDAYGVIPPDATMLADYVHLTGQGEQRLSKIWADGLLPLLEH